jgi:hypothetical protein
MLVRYSCYSSEIKNVNAWIDMHSKEKATQYKQNPDGKTWRKVILMTQRKSNGIKMKLR